MRTLCKQAVGTALCCCVLATSVVATETTVRQARVIETAADLASVFSDAQNAMSYDVQQGVYHVPALGVIYDPVGAVYLDPVTGWSQSVPAVEETAFDFGALQMAFEQAGLQVPSFDSSACLSKVELDASGWMYTTDAAGTGCVQTMNTYFVFPYAVTDAFWFDRVFGFNGSANDTWAWMYGSCGVSYLADPVQIRLQKGVMPQTLEVLVSDGSMMMGDGTFQLTDFIAPVSEEVWENSTVAVECSLTSTWSSMSSGFQNLDNGMYAPTVPDTAEDAALRETYANDDYYTQLFSSAVYHGYWAFGDFWGEMLDSFSLASGGWSRDTDGDGLMDVDEFRMGTSWRDADSDGDGLNDAVDSDPNNMMSGFCVEPDTDGDGLPDYWEMAFGLDTGNPFDAELDYDGDGLSNLDEYTCGTSPITADTDLDGLGDGEELAKGTGPLNPDTDGDGLTDGLEVCLLGTSPFNPDTDGDGLPDGFEWIRGLNALLVDSDDDGICDTDEQKYGLLGLTRSEKDGIPTALCLRDWLPVEGIDLILDTDGDGWADDLENLARSNPKNANDTPVAADGICKAVHMVVELTSSLATPVILEVGESRLCLRKAGTWERWFPEGEWQNVRLVGRQGQVVPLKISFDGQAPNAASSAVKSPCRLMLRDPSNLFGGTVRLPSAAESKESTEITAKFAQPSIQIDPQYICFHGTCDRLTVRASLLPLQTMEETATVPSLPEWTWTDNPDDALASEAVNVFRDRHVGHTLHCVWHDRETGEELRALDFPVTECAAQKSNNENEFDENAPEMPSRTPAANGKLPAVALNGQSATNDYGVTCYVGPNDLFSLPVNDDDDDADGLPDYEMPMPVMWLADEDDLRTSCVRGFSDCCPCPDHERSATCTVDTKDVDFYLHSVDHPSVCKLQEPFIARGTPIWIGGRTPSATPGDAWVQWTDSADSSRQERLSLTVYGIRLIPDLNWDGKVDVDDRTLVKGMERAGRGWVVQAGTRRLFRVKPDIQLPGTLTLKVNKRTGDGTFSIYAHATDDTPLTTSSAKDGVEVSVRADTTYQIECSQPDTIGTIEVRFTGTGVAEGYECVSTLRVTGIGFSLAGDGGIRDQKIDFDDPDDTNVVFWVNNDCDAVYCEENRLVEDDTGGYAFSKGVPRNCDDDVIGAVFNGADNSEYIADTNTLMECLNGNYTTLSCFRDLEDFDRLHLRVDSSLLSDSEVDIQLKFEVLSGDPQINVFKAVRADQFYLTDKIDGVHADLLKIARSKQMAERRLGTVKSSEWTTLARPSDGTFSNAFLYEGKSAGRGILKIRLVDQGCVLGESQLEMSLHDVSAFTDHVSVKDATDPTKYATCGELFLNVAETVEPKGTASAVYAWNHSESNMLVCVFGWNMAENETENWRDTVFKRLFWQGYKGRVVALQWPCRSGWLGGVGIQGFWQLLTDACHFDMSEHRAWLSALPAADYLNTLAGQTQHLTVLAHSQGNVLACQALQYVTPETQKKLTYLALQGAISAQFFTQAYDITQYADKRQLMIASGLKGEVLDHLATLKSKLCTPGPDIEGHFHNGFKTESPYLANVLANVRAVNFYNRTDYALDAWLVNNVTKPDNLDGKFGYDTSFGYTETAELNSDKEHYFDFWSNYPDADSNQHILNVKDRVADRWCVFSFVQRAYAPAIGLIPVEDVFAVNYNLEKQFNFDATHYCHSKQFRSNLAEMSDLWRVIYGEAQTRK